MGPRLGSGDGSLLFERIPDRWIRPCLTFGIALLAIGYGLYELSKPVQFDVVATAVKPDIGQAFVVDLRHQSRWPWTLDGDRIGSRSRSHLSLYEDGRPLGPAHAPHGVLQTQGEGRFSHWNHLLLFSTSDNSDPRTNGRVYSVSAKARIAAPLIRTLVIIGGICITIAYAALVAIGRRRPRSTATELGQAGVRELSPTVYWLSVGGALLLLLLMLYLNTGTLIPMALTGLASVVPDTGYVYSDDYHFVTGLANWLLGRADANEVDFFEARRILWNLLALPFHATLGVAKGTFVFNFLLYGSALLVFAWQGRRLFGARSTLWMLWLISTFPAVGYFGGLVAHYAIIVPACLMIALLLESFDATASVRKIVALSGCLGLLCLGYDLLPFVAPSIVILLLSYRRWKAIPPALAAAVMPLLLWVWYLQGLGIETLDTQNTRIYINPVVAWMNYFSWNGFWQSITALPAVLWTLILHSSFTFLPLLAGSLLLANLVTGRARLKVQELAIFVTGLALIAFPALTPSMPSATQFGWMLNGNSLLVVARFFLPLFLAYLLVAGRCLGALAGARAELRLPAYTLAIICILGNAWISAGLFLGNPGNFAASRYEDFYGMHRASWVDPRLDYLGRRPFGFPRPILTLAPIGERDQEAYENMRILAELSLKQPAGQIPAAAAGADGR